MKAIVYTEYGSPDVLHLDEVAKPAPKDNEVLIRVHATPVNFGDLMARNFKSSHSAQVQHAVPLLAARAPGVWAAANRRKTSWAASSPGKLKRSAKHVTRFKPGDQVFGYRGQSMGAYAEYLCMPEDGVLAIKPANMTYEEAATVPYGALMALSLLKKGQHPAGTKGA